MRGILEDLRYAARVLRRTPTLTTVAIITLAFGIAATTTVLGGSTGWSCTRFVARGTTDNSPSWNPSVPMASRLPAFRMPTAATLRTSSGLRGTPENGGDRYSDSARRRSRRRAADGHTTGIDAGIDRHLCRTCHCSAGGAQHCLHALSSQSGGPCQHLWIGALPDHRCRPRKLHPCAASDEG